MQEEKYQVKGIKINPTNPALDNVRIQSTRQILR